MGHRIDSVVFLRGNLTEGFQAHGPYPDYDECSDANDMEGWMMGVEAPGYLISLSIHGVTDEGYDLGEFYVPRDWMHDEIQARVASLYREWRDQQEPGYRSDLAAFSDALAKHFRRAPEVGKVEVDIVYENEEEAEETPND